MVAFRVPVWSRLTRVQRILLGAVIAVVALFVASVATSGRTGEGSAEDGRSGIVSFLGGLLGGSATVPRSDLSADCLGADGRLVIKGSCVLRVAAGDGDVRKVTLHAKDAVSVQAPSPQGGQLVTDDLDAGKDVSVAVNSGATDITLRCRTGDTCVATL